MVNDDRKWAGGEAKSIYYYIYNIAIDKVTYIPDLYNGALPAKPFVSSTNSRLVSSNPPHKTLQFLHFNSDT